MPPASPDVYRFKIGALDAAALKDGDLQLPNDGKTVGVGQPPEAVGDLLAAAGLPRDRLDFSIQPLLVRAGERVLLFDTGAAAATFAKAGRLPSSLRAAGVEPAQVTDVFISHGDFDHVNGLVSATGALAFPNAAIHISAPEWAAMQRDREQPALVDAIASKVRAFAPGAALVPGVTAVAAQGHTPGHSAYLIESAGERLLYIGDTAHHVVISVQRPDWTIAFDRDAPAAQAMRRTLLQRAATEGVRVFAVHFPFPGLGHVRAQGDSFVWNPDA